MRADAMPTRVSAGRFGMDTGRTEANTGRAVFCGPHRVRQPRLEQRGAGRERTDPEHAAVRVPHTIKMLHCITIVGEYCSNVM